MIRTKSLAAAALVAAASIGVLAHAEPARDDVLERRLAPLRARRLEPDRAPFGVADVRPFAVALLAVGVPVAAGIALGRALRRRGAKPSRATIVAVAAPIACVALAPVVPIGIWDLLSTGLLFGVACRVAALERTSRVRFAVAAGAVGVALGLGELAVRAAGLRAPHMPNAPRDSGFLLTSSLLDDPRCLVLQDPEFVSARERASLRAGGPRVLHLGDSMVEGVFVRETDVFTGRLAKRTPGVAHLNGGVTGASPDWELLFLRNVVDRVKPDHVVLHLFPGNDHFEMGQVYSCCPEGPLLQSDGGALRARCPEPRWRFSLHGAAVRTPPPYPLRVAATLFELPRHAWASLHFAQLHAAEAFVPGEDSGADGRWRQLERVLRTMRAELEAKGIRFTIAVVPYRPALERALSGGTAATTLLDEGERRNAHWRHSREYQLEFVEVSRRAGVETFDAWPAFEARLRREPAAKWWQSLFPGDPHFDVHGHAAYAEWLDAQLGDSWRALATPPTTAAE